MAFATSVVLGAVFLFSGVLKLRDPAWPAAARALGAPPWSVPVVAPVEITLGLALVVGVGVAAAAAFSIVLLVVFSALLALAIGRPDPPSCSCFGSWSSRPVGPASLVRNGALMALAVATIVFNA